jgi:integrase
MIALLPALIGQELARQLQAALQAAQVPADPRDLITVAQVMDAYFAEKPDDLCPAALRDRENICLRFAAVHGGKRVEDCRPLVLSSWIREQASWKSPWTKKRVLAHVKRVFRWAVEMRLIRGYPFAGVKLPRGKNRRPMRDDEFQVFLRNNPGRFRRLLIFLKYSGCRPCEASKLRWSGVDFEANVAQIHDHKTAKKIAKARQIILHPLLVRLLRWLERRKPPDVLRWVADVLTRGPVHSRDLAAMAKERNLFPYLVFKAAAEIGAKKRYRGPKGSRSRAIYYLPGPPRLPETPADGADGFVFLNGYGRPWSQASITRTVHRMRKKGLTVGLLYGLRHRFGTEACKRGLNLKVVASLMGHAGVITTEAYVSTLGDDVALLHAELQKIAFGAKPLSLETHPCDATRRTHS